MEHDHSTQDLLIKIDQDLSRKLSGELPRSTMRLAPSLRGIDLAEIGSIVSLSVGTVADFVTIILSRDQIEVFARHFISAITGKASKDDAKHLRIDLSAGSEKIVLDLATTDPARLSEALRAIAKLADGY